MSVEKLTAIIVIYNKEVTNSITYKNIKNMTLPNLDVLVVDNSTIENNNLDYCKKNGINYVSMNGNVGLSKAYNSAIDLSKDSDVFIFFDDDTEITEEYFKELSKALVNKPDADIFTPIIYGQDGIIYSPNEANFMKNRFVKNPEDPISQDKFNAIASCLAVRKKVFDEYRFNEILFVDQVDQNFFDDQRARNIKFAKLNVNILQNFYQRGATLTPDAGWKRLRLRIIDIMRYAKMKKKFKYTLLGYIKCCGLGVQIGRKCKSILLMVKAVILSTSILFKSKTEN